MAQTRAVIDVQINTGAAAESLRALQGQINAFNSALNRGNKTQLEASKQYASMLSNMINSGNFFTAQMVRMETAASRLDKTLSKGQGTIGQFFNARFRKDSAEAAAVMSLAHKRAAALQTQFIATTGAANGFRDAMAIRPMQAFNSSAAVSAEKLAIQRAMLNQATTSMINFGKNTQWAGRQLMVGFTVPLTIFGATAGKTFREIEMASVSFKKVYGDAFTPPAEMQKNLDAVKELAKEYTKYGIAVKDTIDLAAQAAAAGAQGQALMDATAESTRLATLGQLDQNKALEATIALQNAFGLSGKELAKTVNFLNMVENQTVVTLQDLTEAIPRVAPVIKGLGGSIEDMAAMLAAMQEGGVSAAQGANALKSGLASLINPTNKAIESLGKMGINLNNIVQANRGDLMGTVKAFATALQSLDEFSRQQALEQVFGKYQYARLGALFNNIIKDGSQASRVMDTAAMSAEQLAATANKELGTIASSPAVKFTAAMERLKLAIAPIGEMFTKIAIPVLEFLSKIADAFNNLPDGVKKFAAIGAVIVGVVIPAGTMFLGLLMNLVGTLIKFGSIAGTTFKGFATGGISGAIKAITQSLGYMSLAEIDAATASRQLGGATEIVNQALREQPAAAAGASAAVDELAASYSILIQRMQEAALMSNTSMGAFGIPGAAMGRARGGASNLVGRPLPIVARNRGGSIPYLSNGGTPTVPGAGNKDTVPAMLTPGEFVVNKQATKQNLALLHAINNGKVEGFSLGGGPLGMSPAQRLIMERMAVQEAERLALVSRSRAVVKPAGQMTSSDLYAALASRYKAGENTDVDALRFAVEMLGISPDALRLSTRGNLIMRLSPRINLAMMRGKLSRQELLKDLDQFPDRYSPIDAQIRSYYKTDKSIDYDLFDAILRQKISDLDTDNISNTIFEQTARSALSDYLERKSIPGSTDFINAVTAGDHVSANLGGIASLKRILDAKGIPYTASEKNKKDLYVTYAGRQINLGTLAGREVASLGRSEGILSFHSLGGSGAAVHANKGGMIPGIQYRGIGGNIVPSAAIRSTATGSRINAEFLARLPVSPRELPLETSGLFTRNARGIQGPATMLTPADIDDAMKFIKDAGKNPYQVRNLMDTFLMNNTLTPEAYRHFVGNYYNPMQRLTSSNDVMDMVYSHGLKFNKGGKIPGVQYFARNIPQRVVQSFPNLRKGISGRGRRAPEIIDQLRLSLFPRGMELRSGERPDFQFSFGLIDEIARLGGWNEKSLVPAKRQYQYISAAHINPVDKNAPDAWKASNLRFTSYAENDIINTIFSKWLENPQNKKILDSSAANLDQRIYKRLLNGKHPSTPKEYKFVEELMKNVQNNNYYSQLSRNNQANVALLAGFAKLRRLGSRSGIKISRKQDPHGLLTGPVQTISTIINKNKGGIIPGYIGGGPIRLGNAITEAVSFAMPRKMLASEREEIRLLSEIPLIKTLDEALKKVVFRRGPSGKLDASARELLALLDPTSSSLSRPQRQKLAEKIAKYYRYKIDQGTWRSSLLSPSNPWNVVSHQIQKGYGIDLDLMDYRRNMGGIIPGFNSGGFLSPTLKASGGNIVPGVGYTDTVPAMLTPGEFVINKEATQQNLPLLHAINDGVAGYNVGGMIPRYAFGGMLKRPNYIINNPAQQAAIEKQLATWLGGGMKKTNVRELVGVGLAKLHPETELYRGMPIRPVVEGRNTRFPREVQDALYKYLKTGDPNEIAHLIGRPIAMGPRSFTTSKKIAKQFAEAGSSEVGSLIFKIKNEKGIYGIDPYQKVGPAKQSKLFKQEKKEYGKEKEIIPTGDPKAGQRPDVIVGRIGLDKSGTVVIDLGAKLSRRERSGAIKEFDQLQKSKFTSREEIFSIRREFQKIQSEFEKLIRKPKNQQTSKAFGDLAAKITNLDRVYDPGTRKDRRATEQILSTRKKLFDEISVRFNQAKAMGMNKGGMIPGMQYFGLGGISQTIMQNVRKKASDLSTYLRARHTSVAPRNWIDPLSQEARNMQAHGEAFGPGAYQALTLKKMLQYAPREWIGNFRQQMIIPVGKRHHIYRNSRNPLEILKFLRSKGYIRIEDVEAMGIPVGGLATVEGQKQLRSMGYRGIIASKQDFDINSNSLVKARSDEVIDFVSGTTSSNKMVPIGNIEKNILNSRLLLRKLINRNSNQQVNLFKIPRTLLDMKKERDREKRYANIRLNTGNIVPGVGNKDTVPAMLTPGEFVVNKQATEKNLGLLHAINGGMINGYAIGGLVEEGQDTTGKKVYRNSRGEIVYGNGRPVPSERIMTSQTTSKATQRGKMGGGMGRGMGAGMGLGMLGGAMMMAPMIPQIGQNQGLSTGLMAGGMALSMASILPMLGLSGPAMAAVAGIAALGVATTAVVMGFNKLKNSVSDVNNAMLGSTDRINKLGEAFGRPSAVQQVALQRAQAAGGGITAESYQAAGTFMQSDAGKQMLEDLRLVQKVGKDQSEALKNQLERAILAGVISPEEARSVAIQVGQALGDQKIGVKVSARISETFGPNGERLKDGRIALTSQIIPKIDMTTLDQEAEATIKRLGQIDWSRGFDLGAAGMSIITLGGTFVSEGQKIDAQLNAISNAAKEAAAVEKEARASVILEYQNGITTLDEYRAKLEQLSTMDISGKAFKDAAAQSAAIYTEAYGLKPYGLEITGKELLGPQRKILPPSAKATSAIKSGGESIINQLNVKDLANLDMGALDLAKQSVENYVRGFAVGGNLTDKLIDAQTQLTEMQKNKINYTEQEIKDQQDLVNKLDQQVQKGTELINFAKETLETDKAKAKFAQDSIASTKAMLAEMNVPDQTILDMQTVAETLGGGAGTTQTAEIFRGLGMADFDPVVMNQIIKMSNEGTLDKLIPAAEPDKAKYLKDMGYQLATFAAYPDLQQKMLDIRVNHPGAEGIKIVAEYEDTFMRASKLPDDVKKTFNINVSTTAGLDSAKDKIKGIEALMPMIEKLTGQERTLMLGLAVNQNGKAVKTSEFINNLVKVRKILKDLESTKPSIRRKAMIEYLRITRDANGNPITEDPEKMFANLEKEFGAKKIQSMSTATFLQVVDLITEVKGIDERLAALYEARKAVPEESPARAELDNQIRALLSLKKQTKGNIKAVIETGAKQGGTSGGAGGAISVGQQLKDQFKQLLLEYQTMEKFINKKTGSFKGIMAGPFGPQFIEYLKSQGEEGLKVLKGGFNKIKAAYEEFRKVQMQTATNFAQTFPATMIRQRQDIKIQERFTKDLMKKGFDRETAGAFIEGIGGAEGIRQYQRLNELKNKGIKLSEDEKRFVDEINKARKQGGDAVKQYLAAKSYQDATLSLEQMNKELDNKNRIMALGFTSEEADQIAQLGDVSNLSSQQIKQLGNSIKQFNINTLAASGVEKLTQMMADNASQMKDTQRQLDELNIIKPLQDQLDVLGRQIELKQRELEPIDEAISKLEEEKNKINEVYDARIKALEEIEKINQRLVDQQKQQLDLASALSRGDIASAANTMMEIQSQQAQYSREDIRAGLEQGRQAALASKDVAINKLKEQRKVIEDEIKKLQNDQRKIQDDIYTKQSDLNSKYDTTKDRIIALTKEMKELANNAERYANALEKAKNAVVPASTSASTSAPTPAPTPVGTGGWSYDPVRMMWINSDGRSYYGDSADTPEKRGYMYGGNVSYKGSREPAPGMMFGGRMKKYAMGSFVPGIGITDKVPALLTPGEFVVRKSVAETYGPLLSALNSQVFPSFNPNIFPASMANTTGPEVEKPKTENHVMQYNYTINVTAETNASPDDIANVVMRKIKMTEDRGIRSYRS